MSRRDRLHGRVLDSYLSVYPPGRFCGDLYPIWAIGITLGGRSEDTTADGRFSQRRHDFTILTPQADATHRWRVPPNGGPWKILWFLVSPTPVWLNVVPLPEILPGVFQLSLRGRGVESRVRKALYSAHRMLHSRWPNRYELGLNLLEHALLLAQAAVTEQAERTDPRILRAMDYLTGHLFEPLRLAHLCRHAGLCRSRLLQLFQKETGTTPRMYRERERLRHAQNLLRFTDKPVKEIAAIVGYKYPPHFAQRFRQGAGITPLQFRRRLRRWPAASLLLRAARGSSPRQPST